MHKFIITACAVALAGAWTVAPAIAQDKPAEPATDKTESKMDKVKDKAVETKDKIKEKAVEAKDTIKEKATEVKDKLKAKTERAQDRMEAKTEKADVRMAQQALRDKGHDPGPIDGIHGPRTSAALRNFQKAEGLTVTGRLDDETMARLNVRTGRAEDKEPAASPPTTGAPPPQRQN